MWFTSHCDFMNADWRLANFDIKKQSTIWVEWKFLRLEKPGAKSMSSLVKKSAK